MKVRPFNVFDLKIINQWALAYSKSSLEESDVPSIGFIVEKDGILISAAFLRKVECGYGLLDGLIANPEILGDFRNEAISKAIEQVIKTAKQMNLKGLIAHTGSKKVINHGLRFGFNVSSETLIALDLKE